MATKEQRLESIRAALKGVPLDDLRKAGASLPPQLARILEGVANALDGETVDEEALVQALDQLPQPEELEESLSSVGSALKSQAAQMRSRLRVMKDQFSNLAQHREAIRKGFQEMEGLAEDDPELAEILGRAESKVADDAPWTASRDLLDRTEALVSRLESSGDLASADDLLAVDLAKDGAELERASNQLQAATEPLLKDLPELLDEAAELALARDHSAATVITVQAARVWEVRAGMGHPDAVKRWDRAFITALHHKLLPAAWIAGKRLQASALPDQDYKRVAVIAHQVADLAYTQGARTQAVQARMEEAQCLARMPDHHEAARTYGQDALEVADKGDDPALQTQARLMYGQTLEIMGDEDGAQKLYKKALRQAKGEADLSPVHGRIALHLGRLQATRGQTHLAGKHMGLAQDIALAQGDAALLSAVMTPAIQLALSQEDDAQAGQVLRAVVQAFAQGGSEGPILAHAVEQWGQERVNAWLKG